MKIFWEAQITGNRQAGVIRTRAAKPLALQRCFGCQQKGHLHQDCPKKPPYKPANSKPWEKAKTPTQEAHATKIEVDDETDTKKLAKQVAHLDKRGKEDLFQVLLDGPGF